MKTNSQPLIAYFSATGTTAGVAQMIAEVTDGTLYEIVPQQIYTSEDLDWNDRQSRSSVEMNNPKARPALKKTPVDVRSYDVIFIGYPNWWGDMPMPVYTFIGKHHWQGKAVIPFCTHEGSGLSDTGNKLKTACKGTTILKGLAVRGATAQNAQAQAKESVKDWLSKLKL